MRGSQFLPFCLPVVCVLVPIVFQIPLDNDYIVEGPLDKTVEVVEVEYEGTVRYVATVIVQLVPAVGMARYLGVALHQRSRYSTIAFCYFLFKLIAAFCGSIMRCVA